MNNNELLEQFNEMKCMPLFEYALPDDEYLVVNLTADNKGLYFSFDENSLDVSFDGEIEKVGGSYHLPWDDCFGLDEHLQTIDNNMTEGFLMPNNLFV